MRRFHQTLLAAPFWFLQLSDPQFGMQSKNQDFAQETATFEFAIATANRLKPAFVVVTGDLVNKPGDPAQTSEYLRIAARIDPSIEFYHVPGNHDVGERPTPATLEAYRKRFGRDYFAFRHGDFAGIVLDTALIQQPGGAPDEALAQEQWLKAELGRLKSAGAAPIVVFQHHPLFVKDPDEPGGYFNIPPETRRKYLELFETYGVRHVFAGHYHRNAAGRAGSLEMVTSGPVGMPLDQEQSGLRIVTVGPGTALKHEYYPLGALPNRVVLQ